MSHLFFISYSHKLGTRTELETDKQGIVEVEDNHGALWVKPTSK